MNNILLQTVEVNVLNLNQQNTGKSCILFDSGAQCTYITRELNGKLNPIPFKQEKIAIKAFGGTESKVQNIDAVKFILKSARKNVYVKMLVIPTICSNLYNQVTGQFSGPYSSINNTNVYNMNSSHFLFVPPSNSRYVFEIENDHKLSTIWDIESVEVNTKELEIYQSFENDLEFTGERYSVKLPFKPMTELVSENLLSSKKRLSSLKYILDCNQKLKEQYDNILKDYEK